MRFGPFEHGDVADPIRLAEVLRAHKPAAVLHFAARSNVGESTRDPLRYYAANTAATVAMLRVLAVHGVDRVVFSSTCATYGLPDSVPLTEATPQRPINPYGRSKLMVEDILREAGESGRIHSAALRYFNAAGAAADGSVGEEHDPETHLIPLVLSAALDPDKAITIYGTDYATDDGTCIRDYVHVEDLADAHVKALERLLSGAMTGFNGLNVGSGLGLSVREVIAAARRVTNCEVRVVEGPRRAGDPATLVADFSAAAGALGYAPRHLDIDAMVASAHRFMVDRRPTA